MASAAIRRCAARSLQLRQPLEQKADRVDGCANIGEETIKRKVFSVHNQRSRCSSSDTRSRGSMEPKSHINEKKEDIYQRLSTKIDKISDGLDEQARLLKQLEVQIQENNKHAGAIDLTPWVVSMSASFLMVGLYNYVQG